MKLRKLLPVLFALALVVGTISNASAEIQTLRGTIVDNMCYMGHQANIAEFVKTHPESCVLMPGCRDSGMLLFQADGTLIKFDEAGSKKIVKWLEENEGDNLKVVVKIEKNESDDTYRLISIESQ